MARKGYLIVALFAKAWALNFQKLQDYAILFSEIPCKDGLTDGLCALFVCMK